MELTEVATYHAFKAQGIAWESYASPTGAKIRCLAHLSLRCDNRMSKTYLSTCHDNFWWERVSSITCLRTWWLVSLVNTVQQSVPAIGDPLIGDSPVHLAVRQGGTWVFWGLAGGWALAIMPLIHFYQACWASPNSILIRSQMASSTNKSTCCLASFSASLIGKKPSHNMSEGGSQDSIPRLIHFDAGHRWLSRIHKPNGLVSSEGTPERL